MSGELARDRTGEERAPRYWPWGRVTSKFWATPAGEPTSGTELAPDTIRFRLEEVVSAARDGRIDDAAMLAGQLDRDTTDAYSEGHIYSVQVREVRGYVAALAGDFATGVRHYLHCARTRLTIHGHRHPDVEQSTLRAYSMWRAMPMTEERFVIGNELLGTAVAILGADAPLAREIRSNLWSRMLPAAGDAARAESVREMSAQ
ncbi:hypothetical protein ACWCXB_24030 [Streptomyces sp. NPDC001514]